MQTAKQREWYLNHRNLTIKRSKKWKAKNKQKVSESSKKYRSKNKDAIRARDKAWRFKNPNKVYEQGLRYVAKHKKEVALRKRNWTRKNKDRLNQRRKEKYRIDIVASRKKFNDYYKYKYSMEKKTKRQAQQKAVWLKFKYNLTPEQLEEMTKDQNGKCLICTRISKLHVDHCHKSNKVRGLLCFTCNVGLGNFKDSPIFLKSAMLYLKKHAS